MKIWLSSQRSFSVKRNYFHKFIHLFKIVFTMYLFLNYCAADCPHVCECKWKDGKESVTCKNTNLTSIPRKLDAGILVLNFIGNSLLKLGNNVFEDAGLLNLQKLYLIKCDIKSIDKYAFKTLNNLVDLDLSYNVLTIVPSQAFAPIPDLRELKLNGNPILKIGGYAFTYVHRLIRLEVAECRIGYIDQKAFKGLGDTLEWLKLNRNRLIDVQPETFTILQSLHGLDLNENPLNCSCVIRPLRDWMLNRSLSVSTLPSCQYPEHNSNKTWSTLQEDDFACIPYVHAPMKLVNAYEGDNVTLTCKVRGIPTPDVRWTLKNRELLNSTIEYPITNKRPYLIHSMSNNYSNLTILSLEKQDTGEYVCIAENKAGKVIADIVLRIDNPTMGTILSEKVVLIGILVTAVVIIFLCSTILFVRVMYCKHDTKADIESKRRIITEKIEMKRNSANLKRASLFQNTKIDKEHTILTDNQKHEKYGSNSISEEKSKLDLKGIASNNTNFSDQKESPGSSIFDSHIGEMALQHHVLHKKALPTGKLYTTAMAFMTDDVMTNYQNETENPASIKKKTHHYNTMPRNASSNSRATKGSYSNPRVSGSQSPLLQNKYYEKNLSESANSNTERITEAGCQQQPKPCKYSPSHIRKFRDGHHAHPSLPSSPDVDKYWDYNSTKETPLLNDSYKKSKNSHVNYSTYTQQKNIIEHSFAASTYDYHAAQLERFLDEYKHLHSELTKMKETCEKFNRDDVYDRRNLRNYKVRMPLRNRSCDFSFDRRCSSRSSLHRPVKSKAGSFEHPLRLKSCSFERSVSFVPTSKETMAKSTASDDVSAPKSILKKRNESFYGSYDRKSSKINVPYGSSTLPLKRTRLRRFSDSSMEGFFR